jgi:hypothetical protein
MISVDVLLGLLLLASMIGVPTGLVMCFSAAKRHLGKRVALGSVTSFVVLVGVGVARGPLPASPTAVGASTATQSYVEPKPENLSRSQILANFRIRSLSWQKSGFGMFMKASFVIHNDNPMPLKDIEVTCSSSGPSGSIIDTNSRPVFDVVRQKSYLQVDNMDMGFIRSEAVETKCRVTGFSKT